MVNYAFSEEQSSLNFSVSHLGSLKPLVSILIPIYKIPLPWLREMLDSVLVVARAYGNYELILHDDSSEMPEMTRLLEEYAEQDSRIRLSVLRPNGSICVSRQILVERAKGVYLLSFDADDVMMPFNLAEEIDFLESHPDIQATYSRKFFFKDDYEYTGSGGFPPSSFLNVFSMTAIPNGALLRSSAVRQCGGYANVPPGYPDDCALFSRLSFTGRVAMRPAPRVLARIHTPLHANCDYATYKELRDFFAAELIRRPLEYKMVQNFQLPDVPGYLQRALYGAFWFMHQTDRELSQKILEFAVKQFPDDFGCHYVYLRTLLVRDMKEQYFAHCRKILDFCQGDIAVDDCWLLLAAIAAGLEKGYQDEVVTKIYQRGLAAERYIPPEIRRIVKVNS